MPDIRERTLVAFEQDALGRAFEIVVACPSGR
jgi:hypothetical protein